MTKRLDYYDLIFPQNLEKLSRKRAAKTDVREAVTKILSDVSVRGNLAVCDATAEFDRPPDPDTMAFQAHEISHARKACSKTLDALKLAADRIWRFTRNKLTILIKLMISVFGWAIDGLPLTQRPLRSRWHSSLSIVYPNECYSRQSCWRQKISNGCSTARRRG